MKKIVKRPLRETEEETYFSVRSPKSDDKDVYINEIVATEMLKRGYTPEMSEKEALDLAWNITKDMYGLKRARYYFLVDEDFKSDVLHSLQWKYKEQMYSRSGIMEANETGERLGPIIDQIAKAVMQHPDYQFPGTSDEELITLVRTVADELFGEEKASEMFASDETGRIAHSLMNSIQHTISMNRLFVKKLDRFTVPHKRTNESILVNESIEPYLNEGRREVHFLMPGEEPGTYQIADAEKNPIFVGPAKEIERMLSEASDMNMIEIRNAMSSIDKGKRYQMVMLSPIKLSMM